MTKPYVQMVGRMAYVWGWPLVYVYNQRNELTKVPEPVLLNDALPLASPGKDKEANWLPAPAGKFSIWLRTYWPDQAILDGSWKPPIVPLEC